MRTIFLLFVLATLLIGVSGCRAKNTAPVVAINGIDFELPWQVEDTEVIKAAQVDAAQKRFTLANDQYKLDIMEGRIKLNGKDYGPINRGDRVRLTDEGVLSVNGEARNPQDTKP